MVEQPSPCNIERIAKQTRTHITMNVNVIPQVLQSLRNFPRRSKPKLMDGIISRDFMDQPCNCNCALKIDRKCAYNGECRKMCVVYKATCKIAM
jgi:hypothetical protein